MTDNDFVEEHDKDFLPFQISRLNKYKNKDYENAILDIIFKTIKTEKEDRFYSPSKEDLT